MFTAAYVLRVLGQAMFGPRNPRWEELVDVGPWGAVPRVILIATLLTFGFYPRLLLEMIRSATGGA